MPPTALELRFHQEMLDVFDAAKKVGYTPTYFRQMVLDRGGVEAAHALMASPDASDGFRTLAGLGALHLSVEAHVIRADYEGLFSSAEITTARQRLARYGFSPG